MTKAKWTTWEGESVDDLLEETKTELAWTRAEVNRLIVEVEHSYNSGLELAAKIVEASMLCESDREDIAEVIRRSIRHG